MSALDRLDPTLGRAGVALIDYAQSQGYAPRVTSTIRSWWQQQTLWRRYLSGRAQFPAAPPGRSAHEYGWAFDLVVVPDPDAYADLGALWRSWGGGWVGTDRVHFELPGASAWLRSLSDAEIWSLRS